MHDLEIQRVKRTVSAFIEKQRPPLPIRKELDFGFRFDGRSVELFTIRPHWERPEETVESAIAKATYRKTRNQWFVYCQRADMKWHKYGPDPEVDTLEGFLAVIDRDEFGCFFG